MMASLQDKYSESKFLSDECKDQISRATVNSFKPNNVTNLKAQMCDSLANMLDYMIKDLRKMNGKMNEENFREAAMEELMKTEFRLKLNRPLTLRQGNNAANKHFTQKNNQLKKCWDEAIRAKYLAYDDNQFIKEVLEAGLEEDIIDVGDYTLFMKTLGIKNIPPPPPEHSSPGGHYDFDLFDDDMMAPLLDDWQ